MLLTMADGTQCKLFPVPAFAPGDLQEYATVGLVDNAYTCAMPDVNYLVKQEELDNVHGIFPRRQEAAMVSRIARAQALLARGRKDDAEKVLAEWSISKVVLFRPSSISGVSSFLVRAVLCTALNRSTRVCLKCRSKC